MPMCIVWRKGLLFMLSRIATDRRHKIDFIVGILARKVDIRSDKLVFRPGTINEPVSLK